MKKTFTITIIALCLCIGLIAFKRINKAEKPHSETKNPKKIENIFLDYKFGMSHKEFGLHTKRLMEAGEINKEGYYDFKFENYPANGIIEPVFHIDKLYKLNIHLQYKPGSNFSDPDLLFLQAVSLYAQKYPMEKILDGLAYEYTEGNMKIEILNNIYNPCITYYDIESDNFVKSLKEEESKKNTTNTLKNI